MKPRNLPRPLAVARRRLAAPRVGGGRARRLRLVVHAQRAPHAAHAHALRLFGHARRRRRAAARHQLADQRPARQRQLGAEIPGIDNAEHRQLCDVAPGSEIFLG